MFGLKIRRTLLARRAKTLCLALFLAAAASPQAMSAGLDDFNPATTDPDLFRIAVLHSDRLAVPVGAARMLVVMRDRKTGKVVQEKEIKLQQTGVKENLAGVQTERADEEVSVYRIPTRQVEELRALQAKFLALPKARQETIGGTLSIDVTGCKRDAADTGRMLISTYIKTSELPEFIVLEKDYDLRNVPAGAVPHSQDPVRPCS
ncbi:hypothetical protein [Roseibium sp. M-1]